MIYQKLSTRVSMLQLNVELRVFEGISGEIPLKFGLGKYYLVGDLILLGTFKMSVLKGYTSVPCTV
jgi:hypothetical protein